MAYKVKVDYFGGRWVKDHPHPVVEVLAGNAKKLLSRPAVWRFGRKAGRLSIARRYGR